MTYPDPREELFDARPRPHVLDVDDIFVCGFGLLQELVQPTPVRAETDRCVCFFGAEYILPVNDILATRVSDPDRCLVEKLLRSGESC